MKKPQSIQISIPTPCTQAWDEMTPNANGRFCGHCQKTVIDFTGYSDKELFNILAIKQGAICGRFNTTQLQRQISIASQPHSRLYRMFILLGMTLTFSGMSEIQARQTPKVHVIDTMNDNYGGDTSGNGVTLSGIIKDQKNDPLKDVNVYVSSDTTFLGSAKSDANGSFKINLDKSTHVTITFYKTDHQTKTVDIAPSQISTPINVSMPFNEFWLGDTIITTPDKSLKRKKAFKNR